MHKTLSERYWTQNCFKGWEEVLTKYQSNNNWYFEKNSSSTANNPKNWEMELYVIKLLCSKGNIQHSEKTACRMQINLCQLHINMRLLSRIYKEQQTFKFLIIQSINKLMNWIVCSQEKKYRSWRNCSVVTTACYSSTGQPGSQHPPQLAHNCF